MGTYKIIFTPNNTLKGKLEEITRRIGRGEVDPFKTKADLYHFLMEVGATKILKDETFN